MPPPPTAATRAIGHRPRMSMFLRVLVTVTVLVHVPVVLGLWELARRLGGGIAFAIPIVVGVTGVGMFLGRARVGMYDHKRNQLLLRFVDVPYYVHWCACLFTLVPATVMSIVAPIVDLSHGDPMHLPVLGFLYAYGMGLVVCGYGILVRRKWVVVDRVDVTIIGLDPAFDGFRIAQLSDMHIGALTPPAWGARWAERANALGPDLTVVTGDLVTNGTEFHVDIANIVGLLEAKEGVCVSMGNHDYFGEGEPLIGLMRDRGARVMRNEGFVIEKNGARLFLAAIDDTWTKRANLTHALENRPDGVPTVLLAHDPGEFRAAAKLGVELTLSGHTHGGQVALPFFPKHVTLSKLTHHYHLGLYKRGNSTLYVHPGLGTTGPPMRLGVAPAIALITLRAA